MAERVNKRFEKKCYKTADGIDRIESRIDFYFIFKSYKRFMLDFRVCVHTGVSTDEGTTCVKTHLRQFIDRR